MTELQEIFAEPGPTAVLVYASVAGLVLCVVAVLWICRKTGPSPAPECHDKLPRGKPMSNG
jgi:hypothetical protein